MDLTLILVGIIILTALAFDFTNGFHDAANAIATAVGSKSLKPRTALMLAAFGNLVGAFISEGVAKTVGKGIIDPAIVDHNVVFGALSDKIGRKYIIMVGCVVAALTYFPIFKAMTHYANPALEAAHAGGHARAGAQEQHDGLGLLLGLQEVFRREDDLQHLPHPHLLHRVAEVLQHPLHRPALGVQDALLQLNEQGGLVARHMAQVYPRTRRSTSR